MENDSGFEPVDTSKFHKSIRVTFTFGNDRIDVTSKEHVEMIAPPSLLSTAEDAAGIWVELIDGDGAPLFRRPVHDPFDTLVEHHSPDGTIEAIAFPPADTGEFDVLLPLMDEAARGVMRSGSESDFGRVRPPEPFDLDELLPDDGGRA